MNAQRKRWGWWVIAALGFTGALAAVVANWAEPRTGLAVAWALSMLAALYGAMKALGGGRE